MKNITLIILVIVICVCIAANIDAQSISSKYAKINAAQTFTGTQTFSGKILNANGNAAAPTYSFTSDATTGFFSLGSGRFDIALSGTAFADFNANAAAGQPGLILYGATTPSISGAHLTLSNLSGNIRLSQWVDQTAKIGYVQAWESGVGYNYLLSLQPNGGTVKVGGTFIQTNVAVAASAGAALSLDLSTGNNRDITFGAGNITNLTATNVFKGDLTLTLTQDGVGSRLIAWDTAIFKFPSATAPTLSIGAGKTDVIRFTCNGTICRQAAPIQQDVR